MSGSGGGSATGGAGATTGGGGSATAATTVATSDPAAGRQSSEAVLTPDADAPRAARDFAAGTLRRWGVPQWGEPVGLVVSELVTNAVRHAGTVATLRLVPTDSGIVVEVDDAGAGEPRLVPPGDRSGAGSVGAEAAAGAGGLGLAIVDRLAQAWGCTARADAQDGKTVWARLRLPDAPRWPRAGIGAHDEVVLELPWDKHLVPLVRSAVGHLAVRAGFERRDLEDVRLAADELFSLLYAQRPESPNGTAISCRVRVAQGMVALALTAPVPPRLPPSVDDFGWHLLQALVDDLEWDGGERTCTVRAEKRKGGAA